jgi:phosphoenolpyruvate-dependent sugar phosphotransferase system, EIIA 1
MKETLPGTAPPAADARIIPPTAPILTTTTLKLLAPLSGQIWPLERMPDPVFAQKMVGDGASIDPVDAVLVAPCDGEVISLHAAGHAVTLRTAGTGQGSVKPISVKIERRKPSVWRSGR